MDTRSRHVFGPVPSRRLGRSLGVDLVPFKTCSFNCIYCQLGKTSTLTAHRAEYVPVAEVVGELADVIAKGPVLDYVTLSGSGEPTLHSRLDDIVRTIRDVTDKPIAVLTNGSLLFDRNVREACALADVVMPTLAAHCETDFQRIHRPCPGLTLTRHLSGLIAFREQYQTPLWLELFVLKGINASDADRDAFASLVDQIHPDRIQLNTAVRPTSTPDALAVPQETLQEWAGALGSKAEVIAESESALASGPAATESDVLTLCQRRPCTLDQIASGLNLHRNEVVKYITSLLKTELIRSQWKDEREYFVARFPDLK
jgi:wyosine [tRNA(Phe)-imidazoG37] synthetase (radical SAM superfamily)